MKMQISIRYHYNLLHFINLSAFALRLSFHFIEHYTQKWQMHFEQIAVGLSLALFTQ